MNWWNDNLITIHVIAVGLVVLIVEVAYVVG